jgi:hypothetical protein
MTTDQKVIKPNAAGDPPAWGQVHVANELAKPGISISQRGVRVVWLRHDLETMRKRLKALEATVAQEGVILTESQLAALARSSTRTRHRSPPR